MEDPLRPKGGQDRRLGRAVTICILMLVLAGLALREAARIDTSAADVVSVAPLAEDPKVRTVDEDVTGPGETTGTTAAPVSTTASAEARDAISLPELASQALQEAARSTPTTIVARMAASVPKPTIAHVQKTTTPSTRPRAATTTTSTTKPRSAAETAKAVVSPAAGRSQTGVASWFNAPDGSCAHNVIPKGTIVKVIRLSTGVSTTCKVDQGGPADQTRIIDLSMDTFAKVADPSVGLIEVRIEW